MRKRVTPTVYTCIYQSRSLTRLGRWDSWCHRLWCVFLCPGSRWSPCWWKALIAAVKSTPRISGAPGGLHGRRWEGCGEDWGSALSCWDWWMMFCFWWTLETMLTVWCLGEATEYARVRFHIRWLSCCVLQEQSGFKILLSMNRYSSGWWFGTSFLFSHILGIIIPID